MWLTTRTTGTALTMRVVGMANFADAGGRRNAGKVCAVASAQIAVSGRLVVTHIWGHGRW